MSSAQKRKAANDGAAPAKRPKLDYTESIVVLVGPEEISFTVCKSVICGNSRFFEAACRKGWKEGEEKLVRLPEVSPYSFTVYLHWLYIGLIAHEGIDYEEPFKAEADAEASIVGLRLTKGFPMVPHFYDLFCAYIIGDVLQDINLTNIAMTECIKLWEGFYIAGAGPITYGWNNTTENSRLRQWILDTVPCFMDADNFAKSATLLPADCLLEMAKTMSSLIQKTDVRKLGTTFFPTLENACKYHDHTDDKYICPYAPSDDGTDAAGPENEEPEVVDASNQE